MNDQLGKAFIEHSKWRLVDDYMERLKACLDQLSEEAVWERPNESSNSVGNIILHLCGNVRQWMVHGVGGKADIRLRQQEFDERGPISKRELIQRLETVLVEAERELLSFPNENLLDEVVIQGFDETYFTAIFHVVEHFSYHLGQIAYITKAKQNVDLKFFDV
jgi:uncharacterized damage-inducible protein DinB